MKMNKLTMAALALTALGFASTAASAQNVTLGSANDLVLGFQVASGTGATSNLEVDLGSDTLFTNTATLTFAQLKVADLSATYGSSWASVVNWSVSGITPDVAAGSFYLTSTTSIKTNTQAGLGNAYTSIQGFTGGLNGQPQTANSTKSSVVGNNSTPASTIGTSYTAEEQGNGFSYAANAEATGATTLGTTDELYSFTPQAKGAGKTGTFPAAIDLGTFSLSSGGVLTFTGSAAAVPEPSAYALGICAVLLFIVLRRRHSVL